MAPFNAWPILFFTLPTLVWLIDGIGGRGWSALAAAAAIGWWFGFGYFLAGLYWLGYAFLVDAQTFGWLLPFAVVGLPAVLAIYTALGVALARALWQRGALRVVALRSGCAAMCSPVSPGTPSVMRSRLLWPWRKRLRYSESGA
jgi:apolipoprotein N-acyltransferase